MNLNRSTAFSSLLVLTALASVNCSSDPDNSGTAGATSQAGTGATSGSGSGGGGSSTGGTPTAGTSTAGAATGGGGKGGMGGGGAASTGSGGASGSGGGSTGAFALTSPKLTEGAKFADEYTCASGNAGKSVPLTWTAGPSGTLSYAVLLLDTNTMPPFNHWVIWDIPPTTTMLPEGLATDAMLTMPAGAKQKGGQGSGYLGPCPSGNSHVYKFTVYAMDVATLPGAMTSMSTADLATAVEAHDLASASLSGNSDAKKP